MRIDLRCRVPCISHACLFCPSTPPPHPLLGHPNMGGPMRMNPPRGMAMGPQVRQLPAAMITDARSSLLLNSTYHSVSATLCVSRRGANGPLERCVCAALRAAARSLGRISNRHIPDNYSCSNHLFISLCLTELWRYEASSQLHGRSHARNEHVSLK